MLCDSVVGDVGQLVDLSLSPFPACFHLRHFFYTVFCPSHAIALSCSITQWPVAKRSLLSPMVVVVVVVVMIKKVVSTFELMVLNTKLPVR